MAMLPPEVQSAVPSCAESCLSTYIGEQYGLCTNDDFTCMCTQYSSQGYTLGEFAYICLELGCQQPSQSKEASLYNICSAQANAVSPTHSTLTIPATSTTASVTSSTPSPAGTQSSITSSSVFASTTTAASSTGTLAAATAATTSSHISTLTSAQAVGVSIGAFSALIIAVCIVYCIACTRGKRRKKKIMEEKNYDFVDQMPSHFSPYEQSSSRFQAQRQNEKKSLPIYNSYKDGRMGYAQNSEAARTLSQLLPELPGPNRPHPPPRHPGRVKSPPQTPATMFEEDRSPVQPSFPLPDHPLPTPPRQTYQKPTNRERGPVYTSAYTFSPEPVQQPSLSIEIPRQAARSKIPSPVPFPPPPIPQERPVIVPDQRFSGKSQGSATSVLNYYASPEAGGRSPELDKTTPIEDATQKRRPVPKAILVTKPTHPPRAVRNSGGSDTSFESNDLDEPTPPEEEAKNLSPVAEHSPIASIRYPKVPRSSNQAVPRSPPSKISSTGLQGLCEVVTNDRNKMPNYSRSLKAANGTVASKNLKTPEQRQPEHQSLSGSTLAAKRSKSSVAEDLERKLRIDTSHSRAHGLSGTKPDLSKMSAAATQRAAVHESPLKGYGRVTSPGVTRSTMQRKAVPKPIPIDVPGPVKQEVFVRSPLWEPKLTPSRRGDDLYLSVGMASP